MAELCVGVVEAEILVEPGGDRGAPGAAVTKELCGHWDHDGSCRWPHVSELDGTRFRTEFRAPAVDLDDVQRRIEAALRAEVLPDAPLGPARWTVLSVTGNS